MCTRTRMLFTSSYGTRSSRIHCIRIDCIYIAYIRIDYMYMYARCTISSRAAAGASMQNVWARLPKPQLRLHRDLLRLTLKRVRQRTEGMGGECHRRLRTLRAHLSADCPVVSIWYPADLACSAKVLTRSDFHWICCLLFLPLLCA